MLVSVGLRVPRNTIVSNKYDVSVHTQIFLNVRHRRVISPAVIAERTASLEIRLKL